MNEGQILTVEADGTDVVLKLEVEGEVIEFVAKNPVATQFQARLLAQGVQSALKKALRRPRAKKGEGEDSEGQES